MQFTPVTALVGGLTLGIAAVANYAITGRILGISGAFKGFVQVSTASRRGPWLISRACSLHPDTPLAACAQGHTHPWRVLFTAGLVGGAFVAKSITPEAFDLIPATFTVRTSCVSSTRPALLPASPTRSTDNSTECVSFEVCRQRLTVPLPLCFLVLWVPYAAR